MKISRRSREVKRHKIEKRLIKCSKNILGIEGEAKDVTVKKTNINKTKNKQKIGMENFYYNFNLEALREYDIEHMSTL